MSEVAYRVVFSGEIAEGQAPHQVKERLAKLFRKDLREIERLFSGQPLVIKSSSSLEEAKAYAAQLIKSGAKARIVPAGPGQPPRTLSPAAGEENLFGLIDPVETTLRYKLSLLGVAGAMVILPVLYALLVLLIGFGSLYHLFAGTWIYNSIPNFPVAAFFHLVPVVLGLVVFLFLLKPLLMFWPVASDKIKLDPEREADFFAFVEDICEVVDAPLPARIEISCDVNASARFLNGFPGLLKNELVLTVGLPLVAGLSTRQLAGILAHEFGHFSQRMGMRLAYIIRRINYWLHQAVHGRDIFDRKLDEWLEIDAFPVTLLLRLAKTAIRTSRKLLVWLMKAGQALSGELLRQMELDADRYEARVAGSQYFRVTTERLRLLEFAWSRFNQELAETWRQNRSLVDDLPRGIVRKAASYPVAVQEKLREAAEREQLKLYDTHPTDRERIENAAQEQTGGVFGCETPAASLFSDFGRLARRTTFMYYRNELGLQATSNHLVALDVFTKRGQVPGKAEQARENLFVEAYSPFLPIKPGDVVQKAPTDLRKLASEWKAAVTASRSKAVDAQRALAGFEEATLALTDILHAEALVLSGLNMKPEEFGLAGADLESIQQSCREKEETTENQLGKLLLFTNQSVRRLGLSLALLQQPETARRMREALSLQTEAEKLNKLLARTAPVLAQLRQMRTHVVVLEVLLSARSGIKNARLNDRIVEHASDISALLTSMRVSLRDVPHPFKHPKGAISLLQYLQQGTPDGDEPDAVLEKGNAVVERLTMVQQSVAARLSLIALSVEKAWGFA